MLVADTTSPVQVVQFQLEALNRHDLEAFVSVVSEDVIVTDADGAVLINGKASFTDWYRRHFDDHPGLKVELLDRMSLGEWVVDEVMATRYADDGHTHLISVMKVANGVIDSYRIIRD